MNTEEQIFMEGFLCALTCQGTTSGYRMGSDADNAWWKGFKKAKASNPDKILHKLYKEVTKA